MKGRGEGYSIVDMIEVTSPHTPPPSLPETSAAWGFPLVPSSSRVGRRVAFLSSLFFLNTRHHPANQGVPALPGVHNTQHNTTQQHNTTHTTGNVRSPVGCSSPVTGAHPFLWHPSPQHLPHTPIRHGGAVHGARCRSAQQPSAAGSGGLLLRLPERRDRAHEGRQRLAAARDRKQPRRQHRSRP